jgi:hypothetical protein
MKNSLSFLGLMSLCGFGFPSFPPCPSNRPKEAKKCLLPECKTFTMHNGGFCCVGHSKKYKENKKA